MADLKQDACVPCRVGAPVLTDAEIRALMSEVPGWSVIEREGIKRLSRVIETKDFASAMALAVEVGELAEREGHHPDLHVAWGRLGVEIWTHKIRGLHRNDFILAAKVGALAP